MEGWTKTDEEKQTEERLGYFLLGFLCGLVVGVIVGVLIA